MGAIYAAPRMPHNAVPRPAIVTALRGNAPLTIVRGPAGSGKTVAVAAWAAGQPEPQGIWYAVQGGRRLAFWSAVIRLLVDAGIAGEDSAFYPEREGIDPEIDVRALLLRGFLALPRDTTLVLDDFHEMKDREVSDDLTALAQTASRLRIIVLTRQRGHFESPRSLLALSPVIVGAEQLLFDHEEMAALVALVGPPGADDAFVATLHSAVGGLPLTVRGVLMMLDRHPIAPGDRMLPARLTESAAEVLRSIWLTSVGSDSDLDFALRVSVADSVDPQLAQQITGRDDAAEMLMAIEGLGLGLWSDGAGGPSFSFSGPVRDVLRRELAERMPREVAPLTRAAAEWCFANGEGFSALGLAVRIDDLSLASSFVLKDWASVLAPSRLEFISVVGAIPLRKISRYPLLSMTLALAYNSSGLHRVRAAEMFALTIASAAVLGDKVDPLERFVLIAAESIAYRVVGQPQRSVAAGERALARLAGFSLEQRDSLSEFLATFYAQIGLSFLYAGDRSRALAQFLTGYAHCSSLAPVHMVHSLALTAGSYALDGRLDEARQLAEVAHSAPWPKGQIDGYLGALGHVADSLIAIDELRLADAQHHIDVMAPHLETIEHWPLFMIAQAMIHQAKGNAGEGATRLQAAMARGNRPAITPVTRVWLDSTRAWLLVASGQIAAAEALLRKYPAQHPNIAPVWARLFLLSNDPDEALSRLRALDFSALPARGQANYLLIAAVASLRQGNEELAVRDAEKAIFLMRDHGLTHPFAQISQPDRIGLVAALEKNGRARGAEGFIGLMMATPSTWPHAHSRITLTERETEVLTALAQTASQAEIAQRLFVSVNTVKTHAKSLYRKLGVNSRDEALLRASEHGLLGPIAEA